MREILLDGRKLEEKTKAQDYLKERFSFPAYYGNNLDALYDCLTEISDDVKVTVRLFEEGKPYTEKILHVLRDAAQDNEKLDHIIETAGK